MKNPFRRRKIDIIKDERCLHGLCEHVPDEVLYPRWKVWQATHADVKEYFSLETKYLGERYWLNIRYITPRSLLYIPDATIEDTYWVELAVENPNAYGPTPIINERNLSKTEMVKLSSAIQSSLENYVMELLL